MAAKRKAGYLKTNYQERKNTIRTRYKLGKKRGSGSRPPEVALPSIDKFLENPQQSVASFTKDFVKEGYKYLAGILFSIFSFFTMGYEYTKSEILSYFVAIPLMIFASILYAYIWKQQKKEKERKLALKSVGITLNKLANQQTALEQKLNARNEAVEANANVGIYEQCLDTGFIKHANLRFQLMFGWTPQELNDTVKHIPVDQRGHALAKIMVHEDFKQMIGDYITKRLAGNLEVTELTNVWMLHKDGNTFPVNIKVIPIKDNGTHSVQGFITDITEQRSCEERIAALEDVVASVVGLYSKKRAKANETARYMEFIKDIIKGAKTNE